MKGVSAEHHHLLRSKHFYLLFFDQFPDRVKPADQVDFAKLCLFIGDWQEAATTIAAVVSRYESDPNIANYLFYAGVIFKTLGEYDKANNYFFESSQTGPPRHFSQIEMMIIISRNLEEMDDGDGDENAYHMVHAHLLLEGLIDEESDYEDWIADASTWLALADKCVMHQLLRAKVFWTTHHDKFVTLVAGDLKSILALLPPDVKQHEFMTRKLQACAKSGQPRRLQLHMYVERVRVFTFPKSSKSSQVPDSQVSADIYTSISTDGL
ncbi:hypothetical protein B484DRAFT_403130 [Ochromonadaceae sp. CCMP2298]|nr:hypothetical protein B484DRAFT_403130 [Ochromonadaceae sp. CCMP2298]